MAADAAPTERRNEEILVLYGSQTGNSEQAAIEIADKIPERLSTDAVSVTARHMQLDDFIEAERARWTRIVVIVTSSYGVGQAPLGCYKFRDLCDAVNEGGKDKYGSMMKGVTYAMLGLGDSKYTTFFQNPTAINNGLQTAGAIRVGPLGKADASGDGKDAQLDVISRWIEGIWAELASALAKPIDEGALEEARRSTASLCSEVFDDFEGEAPSPSDGGMLSALMLISVPVVISVALAAAKGSLFR
mmetsp:Transcript_20983/g.42322  ORF Transcript_20983/g.42322 Transcript_20983/m.42322 type:complete len:246 (-) Transcript_20983:59-796(-)|eukprot:CAMPEP_0183295084 /NCGR_PEP_ID=MMETSP0160_2-20130417/3174_1 /TAXON_ID=2839 ORGANISM="Odontella Sinensis, Strain Grunow 1884" /NCGR_SAMPLE_ID=MMETSP0160_2 /ASSEMBLY_ACC=CAM_ASM_000250 /LENGTH=245 /DNA_ID=CAMNT_0025456505 /DNA_START=33 /DNA_END=770 /DNA_ORIENTATION=+